MKLVFGAVLVLLVLTGTVKIFAQLPQAGFGETIAFGHVARLKNDKKTAEKFYLQAVELAKDNEQRSEALLWAARIQMAEKRELKIQADKGRSRTEYVLRTDDAWATVMKAAALTGLSPATKAGIELAKGEVFLAEAKNFAPSKSGIAERWMSEFKGTPAGLSRRSFQSVLDNPAATPDQKLMANMKIAESQLNASGLAMSQEALSNAWFHYKAAATTAGASDELRANAYTELIKIVRQDRQPAKPQENTNTVREAYEGIIGLKNATQRQKLRAHLEYAVLLAVNGKTADAQSQIEAARKLTQLDHLEKAQVYQVAAHIHLLGAMTMLDRGVAKAKTELENSVKQQGISDTQRVEVLIKNGTYLRDRVPASTANVPRLMAVNEFRKALADAKADEKHKAEAQYEIGETYRMMNMIAEALTEYKKVPASGGMFYSYAQQRMQALEKQAPAQPK